MMNNYEYIIASLPDIAKDGKGYPEEGSQELLGWIQEHCSEKDNELISVLLEGFDDSSLDRNFYTKALKLKNSFLKEYFSFDLGVRNTKTAYLNKALGRPAGTDLINVNDMEDEDGTAGAQTTEMPEFEAENRVMDILSGSDILARERGLDELMWEKIDTLTTFDYFDIEAILGFIAKLHIIERWMKLNPDTGREMFSRLVDEVRGSYTGIRNAADEAVK